MNPLAAMWPVSAAEPTEKASLVLSLSIKTDGKAFNGFQYTDQVNFVVNSPGGITTMKAASLSSGGAPLLQCDWGQNWHNIHQVLSALGLPYEEKTRHGCSTPRPKDAIPPFKPPEAALAAQPPAKAYSSLQLGVAGVAAVIVAILSRQMSGHTAALLI